MHLRIECGARRRLSMPTNPYIKTSNKITHKKARRYKPKSLEWNNAAIEVKKDKRKEEKYSYHFTDAASTGPYQFKSSSQAKKNNGNKGKKQSTPEGRNGIRKIRSLK